MPKYLTASETMPLLAVTRDELIAFVQSLQADAAFCDGVTIGINGSKELEVLSVPDLAAVTGLVAALAGKQASHALLTALSALSTSADLVPYFTGPGVPATTALTAWARTLIARTSPAAAVADVSDGALPADGAIAALTSSATTTQAEFNALRDRCEDLRDVIAALVATVETLRDRLKTTGGVGMLAD